jgi:hypothetical protein
MLTLKQAIEQNKIPQFIKEHPEVQGDMDAFNRTVEAMVQKSSEDLPASTEGDHDD